MSNPSLFVSPLVRQAARNLHQLELLTEHPAWTDWFCRRDFWRTRRMMARTPDEAAAWLPAMAFAVSCEKDPDVLAEFARWPLPEPLPPEALPWRAALIRSWELRSWEQQRAATTWEKTIRLTALVRLDRRVERLPEWLAEARRAMDLEPQNRSPRLAALAGWRPRPGNDPPHGGKAEAAQAWVRFWEEVYRTARWKLDGLIAVTARLHLAEAGWLSSGTSPERLREEFHQRVQWWPASYHERSALRMLLASVPADTSAPEQQQQDIKAWLELTHRNVPVEKREAVWNMLVAWQREGILERSGRGRLPEPPLLAPALARALEWEQEGEVLQAMAGYVPGLAEVRAHPEAMRAIIARWEALSQSDNWLISQAAWQAAWVGRWNFLRAGALTAEEQARFAADYVDDIRWRRRRYVLLTLAQIRPPGPFPLGDWIRRLSDENNACRLAAHLAIHGWLVDMAGGEQRRQMRQVLRRAGQDTDAGTVTPFVNLPPKVWPDFRRLRKIETALAARQMPPPDAAAENRSAPRAVPARLPEAHPRTGPPGGTGPAATAKSTTRPPSPEEARHE